MKLFIYMSGRRVDKYSRKIFLQIELRTALELIRDSVFDEDYFYVQAFQSITMNTRARLDKRIEYLYKR